VSDSAIDYHILILQCLSNRLSNLGAPCDRLRTAYQDPTNYHSTFLLISEINVSDCTDHVPLIEYLSQAGEEDGLDPENPAPRHPFMIIWENLWNQPGPVAIDIDESLHCARRFLSYLQYGNTVVQHSGTGLALHPDWADIDLAQAWKQKCLNAHPECYNPLKIWPAKPAWVVDVQRQCIVAGSECESLVALSYRWGKTSPIIRDSEMMSKLQITFALQNPAVEPLIPLTIRHAIALTNLLGERYLWVDALCIDHSDKQRTKEQLDLMGAIYANAVFTIVVANTDAMGGIPGLEGISNPRRDSLPSWTAIPWGDETIRICSDDVAGSLSMARLIPRSDEYYKRGWAFQEYMLSQRRLIIDNNGLHWECSRCTWHEALKGEPRVARPRHVQVPYGLADFRSLTQRLSEFNTRSLTYEDDALSAIAGLLAVASRSIHGGFNYGHPLQCFDESLCWTGAVRRRECSTRSEDHLPADHALPSWSWLGWQGEVHGLGMEDLVTGSTATQVFQITQWSAAKSANTEPHRRRLIESTWYGDCEKYKDTTWPLPRGWKRHSVKEMSAWDLGLTLFHHGCEEYFFKHTTLPAERFYYPFPISEVNETTTPIDTEQLQYLFCETQRARLWAYLEKDSATDWKRQSATLRSRAGDEVGSLTVQPDDMSVIFQRSTENPLGYEVLLVAICGYRLLELHFDQPEEWINVLWVEEVAGVSYRRGVGKVSKKIWDEIELENISLILG